MSLLPMREVLDAAEQGNYAVPAFNINSLEQLQAVIQAATEINSPVIIQAVKMQYDYMDGEIFVAAVRSLSKRSPRLPIVLHLDHGNAVETVKEAITLGFTSVMIDGSLRADGKTPASFEENVTLTLEVVDYAHAYGVSVEGELGTVARAEGGSGGHGVSVFTVPEQAQEFIRATGVDSLAVAIGTAHGAYKFTDEPKLAFDVLERIHALCAGTPLVLHGASSVPQEYIAEVNKFGGKLTGARGVPIAMLQKAVSLGIRKINLDTDGRLAFMGALRRYLTEHPSELFYQKALGAGRAATFQWAKNVMTDLGSAGKA